MKSVFAVLFSSAWLFAQAQAPSHHPDFQGLWYSGTNTPLERPAELAGKEFFAGDKEAEDWLREKTAQIRASRAADPVGSYNDLFWEPGTIIRTRRTAMIVDPPDGKIPALTPTARAARDRQQEALASSPNGPEDRLLRERCLIFPTGTPPMIPYQYNSNYQFVQTANELMIYAELNHEVRIIHLDGRPHLPPSVHLWTGDSIGHWEGNALVVDTTNLTGKSDEWGADENLHVVERFNRLNGDTLLYQWTVDDPAAFTKSWRGEYTMTAAAGPIYEYACHEGNYALTDILKGARADDAPKTGN